MTDTIKPSDIHSDSGTRLPLPRREDLPPDALAMFDHFADPNSDTYAGLRGPGCVRLHSPVLAVRQQEANRYIRREAGITTRERELAILATARELDSQFEWMAHEEPARKAGIPEQTIETIRTRGPLNHLSSDDAVVVRLAREAFTDRKVTKETYAVALDLFGTQKLVDISSLMANYAGTALLLAIFDVQLHEGKKPRLPARVPD
jgi:4-carboxymuconolactone decarboxylase